MGEEIDLTTYPPPDLVVEVVVTHDVNKSLTICRELGVPEVWVYRVNKRALEFLCLDAEGFYAAAPASLAFPFLAPAHAVPWVTEMVSDDNVWESRLRAWVRDDLAGRRG